jgi:hypothetical protein
MAPSFETRQSARFRTRPKIMARSAATPRVSNHPAWGYAYKRPLSENAQLLSSPLMMSPNRSHFSPLNRII